MKKQTFLSFSIFAIFLINLNKINAQCFTNDTTLFSFNVFVSNSPSNIKVADFDSDGNLDLSFLMGAGESISVIYGNGNATFSSPFIDYSTAIPGITTVQEGSHVVADVNNDGHKDIVLSGRNPSNLIPTIAVLINDSTGSFHTPVTYLSGQSSNSAQIVKAIDMNNDGYIDILTANSNAPSYSVYIRLNNGNGTFANPTISPVTTIQPNHIIAADFNNDGFNDVISLSKNSGSINKVFYHQGIGSDTLPTSVIIPGITGGIIDGAVAEDFNSDGNMDFALSNRDSNYIALYYGNGTGSFQAPVFYPTTQSPRNIDVADFNNDGKKDILIPTALFNGSTTLEILTNTGTAFTSSQTSSATGAPQLSMGIAKSGDFNNDGLEDIVYIGSQTCSLCPSLTVGLKLNQSYLDSTNQNVCKKSSYIFADGSQISSVQNDTTHTSFFQTILGCDSIIVETLTINNIVNTTSLNLATISANQAGATYQWLDCDNLNIAIAGETNQNFTPPTTGNYAVEVSLNGCVDTSACVNVIITSVVELSLAGVNIYPNPIKEKFAIDLANGNQNTQVAIYGIDGRIIYTNAIINNNKLIIDATAWSKGVYFVSITTENSSNTFKMIKQ
ncbi:MAG: T9SS type A sorting domain-containing protein [Vicingaceae bacterium]|nr:T9SS type A sorting domain-containing protein [Vicingaceae bacterium]